MTPLQLNIATWANRMQLDGDQEAAAILIEWLRKDMAIHNNYGSTPVKPISYNNVE